MRLSLSQVSLGLGLPDAMHSRTVVSPSRTNFSDIMALVNDGVSVRVKRIFSGNALNYSGKDRLSIELSIEDKTDTGQGDTYIIGIALIWDYDNIKAVSFGLVKCRKKFFENNLY